MENVSVPLTSGGCLLKQIKAHQGLARWDGTGLVAANLLRPNLSWRVEILQSNMISKGRSEWADWLETIGTVTGSQ